MDTIDKGDARDIVEDVHHACRYAALPAARNDARHARCASQARS